MVKALFYGESSIAFVIHRLHNLIEYFTYSFYNNVCRSLFEAHKLMFSFSLCIALLRSRNQINELEYRSCFV